MKYSIIKIQSGWETIQDSDSGITFLDFAGVLVFRSENLFIEGKTRVCGFSTNKSAQIISVELLTDRIEVKYTGQFDIGSTIDIDIQT